MRRVFVTGGTGYVGARIAHRFLQEGWAVCVATRGPAAPLPYLPGAEVVTIDFSDVAAMARQMDGAEAVYHLAAANEIVCGRDLALAVRANVTDAVAVLQAAMSAGVPRLVNFSTAHVYGQLDGRIDESRIPAPRHPYGASHLAFESFVGAAHRAGQINGVNLRLSNGFGAPLHAGIDRWSLVVNDLCRQVATDGVITLASDGTPSRDFIGLTDVARIACHIADLDAEQLGDGVFNLGSGKTRCILEMAEMVAKAAKERLARAVPIRLGPAAPPARGAPLLYASDRLAALGLTARTEVTQEIDATLEAALRFFGPPNGA